MEAPQAPVPVSAQPNLARSTSFFSVTINCYFTFRYRRGELQLGFVPERELLGGPSCGVRSFDSEYGSLRRYYRYSTQGTAGKAVWYREGISRTSGETNVSGVHKDSLAVRGFGAWPLASPSNIAKTISCSARPPAR